MLTREQCIDLYFTGKDSRLVLAYSYLLGINLSCSWSFKNIELVTIQCEMVSDLLKEVNDSDIKSELLRLVRAIQRMTVFRIEETKKELFTSICYREKTNNLDEVKKLIYSVEDYSDNLIDWVRKIHLLLEDRRSPSRSAIYREYTKKE